MVAETVETGSWKSCALGKGDAWQNSSVPTGAGYCLQVDCQAGVQNSRWTHGMFFPCAVSILRPPSPIFLYSDGFRAHLRCQPRKPKAMPQTPFFFQGLLFVRMCQVLFTSFYLLFPGVSK